MGSPLAARLARAALRYCLCVGICMAVLCLMHGDIALLEYPLTLPILLFGLGVYVLLEGLDWCDERRR